MERNKLLMGAVILAVVLGLAGMFVMGNKTTPTAKKTDVTKDSETIPTVDASVKVALKATSDKHKLTLDVNGVPASTTSLDYSISYETVSQGSQGIIGDGIEIKDGQSDYSVTRDAGTCSSGSCVWHQITGKVKVEIKFNGGYGEKIFEGEFDI